MPPEFSPVHLLYKIPNYPYYHLFPNYSVTQDINNAVFNRANYGISNTKLFQEDGSTFILINGWKMRRKNQGLLPPAVLAQGIAKISRRVVWTQTHLDVGGVLRVIKESSFKDLEYITIVSHRFLEGYRIFPFLINRLLSTFYDLSVFMPSDVIVGDSGGLGILISSISDIGRLEIKGLGKPRLIDYQSNKRVCFCCGAFFDVKNETEHRINRLKKVKLSQTSLESLESLKDLK